MIATACGRTPINIGKPESHMMQLVLDECGVDPDRILMVGDRLDTDILFGFNTNVQTLFVSETGIHGRADIERMKIQPTFVAPDVTCMVGNMETNQGTPNL